MNIAELLPLSEDEEVSNKSRTLYQQKVGSFLFAAIATRPDIAFAVSKLSQFNQQPGRKHHKAADWVFHYLFWTQDYCICYEGGAQDILSFICDRFKFFVCASNASFANNLIDQKSFQSFLMKLFGGAIVWRANKQDMVTMSSTEAELLAVLQTAREAIYLFCLIKALTLVLPKALMIKCDNWQTIWLLVNKIMKL